MMRDDELKYGNSATEEEEQRARALRREERREQARKRQERRRLFLRIGAALGGLAAIAGICLTVALVRGRQPKNPRYIEPPQDYLAVRGNEDIQESESEAETESEWSYEAHLTAATGSFSESVGSGHGILLEVESGDILAERGAYERISPASMTKILTVLVAAENIPEEKLDDYFTMTLAIEDYSYVHGCSNTGFEVDEQMTVRDLFYGTILPSGADSAVGLATYVAGSHEEFVELMNQKLEKMGLAETSHVTNCVGLYDREHYSTSYDIAMILKAATDNAWCREVLSAHRYTTSATEQHPEGITVSNLFLRRIEDRDTHGEVLCAKTGFVNQSGSCAASLATDNSGREYICVTAGASGSWNCIDDQTALYQKYLPED